MGEISTTMGLSPKFNATFSVFFERKLRYMTKQNKLSVTDADNPTDVTDSNYWVLDTDYTSYAVVWSCTNALIANFREYLYIYIYMDNMIQ